jgi:hypothetical protein
MPLYRRLKTGSGSVLDHFQSHVRQVANHEKSIFRTGFRLSIHSNFGLNLRPFTNSVGRELMSRVIYDLFNMLKLNPVESLVSAETRKCISSQGTASLEPRHMKLDWSNSMTCARKREGRYITAVSRLRIYVHFSHVCRSSDT